MLSIIIPSYNSEKTILSLINSIYKNRSLLPPFEIILVDSSDDKTTQLVQKNFSDIKIVKLNQKTSAPEARNIGIKKSKYDYLIFIDSDCELILKEKLNLNMMEGKILGGFVYPENLKNKISILQYMMEFIDFSPYEKEGEKNFVPSCIMLFKKNINGNKITFPTHIISDKSSLSKDITEDISICNIQRKKGIKIFFTKKIGVRHKNREDFLDFKNHISHLGYLSGRTRKYLDIKGSFLKHFPLISIGLILYRFLRIYLKLFKISLKDKNLLRGFMYPHLLLYFLTIWWNNFYRGLKGE